MHALEEGVGYIENMQPIEAVLGDDGSVSALRVQSTVDDQECSLLKSIFVATGSRPNVAYSFEHRDQLAKEKGSYTLFDDDGNIFDINDIKHCKSVKPSFLNLYKGQFMDKVSLIGDSHPQYHGSVVKVMASAKHAYPVVSKILSDMGPTTSAYTLDEHIDLYNSTVASVKVIDDQWFELVVRSPILASVSQPGQLFRVQAFLKTFPKA